MLPKRGTPYCGALSVDYSMAQLCALGATTV